MTDTITIEIRIFSTLREILGVKKQPLTIQKSTTIRELLDIIVEKFETGRKFVNEIMHSDEPGRVKDYVKFVINGKILLPEEILDSTLDSEGDIIAIFPPVGGG